VCLLEMPHIHLILIILLCPLLVNYKLLQKLVLSCCQSFYIYGAPQASGVTVFFHKNEKIFQNLHYWTINVAKPTIFPLSRNVCACTLRSSAAAAEDVSFAVTTSVTLCYEQCYIVPEKNFTPFTGNGENNVDKLGFWS